jgi:hypothetical protein
MMALTNCCRANKLGRFDESSHALNGSEQFTFEKFNYYQVITVADLPYRR